MIAFSHTVSSFQHVLLKFVLLYCLSIIYHVYKLHAQNLSWDYYIEKLQQDNFYGNGIHDEDLEELYQIRDHPFNVNSLKKGDLERLVFLESRQIEDILFYLYQYGPMESLGELMLIKSLDYEEREFLKFFLVVGDKPVEKSDISVNNLLKDADYTLITRMDIPLYQRDGYKKYSNDELLINPDKKYLGNALYHYVKFQYDYRNRIYCGFNAVKDAGEPFGNNLNIAYDSYSFHFLFKDMFGMETFALGDYRIKTGEGLVFNTAFSMGKEFDMSLSAPVINKHTSTDEYLFLRGVAATVKWNNFSFSPFVSFRKLDARLDNDGNIEALKTDGYHRTWTEFFRKRNVFSQLYGSHLSWNNSMLKFGFTGYYQRWNREFSTGHELYRQYAPKGDYFWGISSNYGMFFPKVSFAGEIAYGNNNNGWATLHKMTCRPWSDFQIHALYRLYSYRYYAPYASAFSEGDKTQNESGFYAGISYRPWSFLTFQSAVDFYYFPWPKYGMSHSSSGIQIRNQIDLRQNDRMRYSLVYSFKKKEKFDVFHYTHRMRLKYVYMPVEQLVFQTECSAVLAHKEAEKNHAGFLFGETCSWVINRLLKTSVSCAYIHASGSLCSLSLYEPGLLYSFSFNNYYEPVFRASATVRMDASEHFMLMLKYGLSSYLQNDEGISSGRQHIDSNLKQDLYLQLRIKF